MIYIKFSSNIMIIVFLLEIGNTIFVLWEKKSANI